MAPSTRRTPYVESFVKKVIEANDLPASVWRTTDTREAIKDADYVITTFQVGGVEAFEMDWKIPLKYGVDQCIADTGGPAGIFRALRAAPPMLELAEDMKELCPDALVLNYVNPMTVVCWLLGTTGVKFVGLCHGVQTTLDLISGYIDVPKDEIDYLCAGTNHLAWFLKIEHNGQDMYPLFKERFEQPGYWVNEKVRGEALRQFGYFMTESTGHLSDYLPYFRRNQELLDLYCDEPAFGGESGAYYKYCKYVADKYASGDILADEPIEIPSRSIEYGSYVIEAIETGRTFKLYGNVINGGMITNLPPDCCAEGPIFVDSTGLHKTVVGDLPPQCAAINLTQINWQRMTAEAALTGDVEHIVHACALDPLTAAVLPLPEIRDMASEMLEAQRQWLPQFEGKTIKPTPYISVPKDVVRAEVPLDPALAIMARFGELGQ
jgi:alpha-galactosidase